MKNNQLVLCLVTLLAACIGGGGDEKPIYNDQGMCLANCQKDVIEGNDNLVDLGGDGMIQTDNITPDNPPDMGQYTCPTPDNPPEECKPKEVRESKCVKYSLESDKKICTFLIGQEFISEEWDENYPYCLSDDDCKKIPSREELIEKTKEAICFYDTAKETSRCRGGLNNQKECTLMIGSDPKDTECNVLPSDFLDNPHWPYPPCVCWEVCWLPNLTENGFQDGDFWKGPRWACDQATGQAYGAKTFGTYFDNGETCKLASDSGYYVYSPETKHLTGDIVSESWETAPERIVIFNDTKTSYQVFSKEDSSLLTTCTLKN